MDQERNLGVTEARFGLTIVICMLAAIGFFVLLRLGNTNKPTTVEVRPRLVEQGPQQASPMADNQVQVLQVEPEPRAVRRTELLQATYRDTGIPASTNAKPDLRR